MMTSGVTSNPDAFVLNMMRAVEAAEVLCSKAEADTLLSKLAKSSHTKVANEARELIQARKLQ